MAWKDIDLDKKLVQNVQDAVLTSATGAIENCFTNNSGGLTRFPGLVQRYSFGGTSRTYLSKFQGDLMVCCAGQVYRVDQNLIATNVTGVPVSGNGRVIFALGDEELLMASSALRVRRLRFFPRMHRLLHMWAISRVT